MRLEPAPIVFRDAFEILGVGMVEAARLGTTSGCPLLQRGGVFIFAVISFASINLPKASRPSWPSSFWEGHGSGGLPFALHR